MHQRSAILWSAVLTLLTLLTSTAPLEAADVAADTLLPLDTRQVKVAGAIGYRIDLTIEKNILAIDHEKSFLRYFRDRNRKPFSYVGLGKEIDALVRLAYSTGDPRLVALKKQVVEETIETQLDDGYVGIFSGGRLNVWWDIHELSYVIYALVQDYRYFGDKASLAAARKAGDYMIAHRPTRPVVFHVSTIGFERAFLALFQATGDKKYLEHANFHDSLAQWHPPVSGHAYDFLNLCVAQLDLHDVTGDQGLLAQSRRTRDFLTSGNGLLIDGTCSWREGWHTNQAGNGNAGETCATSYLIRLSDKLLRVEGDSFYGDLMERAIYNALFAAQSPDGRELRKYTPLDGPRSYYQGEPSSDFQRDDYCCPNNFRRAIADLPGMIYYRQADAICVNLYTTSQATIALDKGLAGKELTVKISQQTDYPNSGRVALTVDPTQPAQFAMRLRIPAWCTAATVSYPGESKPRPAPAGAFYTISRRWKPGDRIELEMPMTVRLVRGRASRQGKVAVMRGPMLFCFNPALNRTAMKDLRFDLTSLEGPAPDRSIRPDGQALTIKAWGPGARRDQPPTLSLRLTEFADPGGEAVYFDYARGESADARDSVDDELCKSREKRP